MARIWIGFKLLRAEDADDGAVTETLDESNTLAAPSDVLLKNKIVAFEQAAPEDMDAPTDPAWQIMRVDIGKPSVEKLCALLERSGYIEQPSALGVDGCGYDRVQIFDVVPAPGGPGSLTLKKRRS